MGRIFPCESGPTSSAARPGLLGFEQCYGFAHSVRCDEVLLPAETVVGKGLIHAAAHLHIVLALLPDRSILNGPVIIIFGIQNDVLILFSAASFRHVVDQPGATCVSHPPGADLPAVIHQPLRQSSGKSGKTSPGCACPWDNRCRSRGYPADSGQSAPSNGKAQSLYSCESSSPVSSSLALVMVFW